MASDASTRLKIGRIIENVVLVLGLVACPLMVAVLWGAYAEAFHGDKMPMAETLMGLVVGAVLSACTLGAVLALWGARRGGAAMVVICVLVLFDVAAIPVARWLIRAAYASPTNMIEWW